jgi:hypothetical protein
MRKKAKCRNLGQFHKAYKSVSYSKNSDFTAKTLMKQHVFTLSLIKEGTIDKVIQSIMLLKSKYNKNFCFNEQKCLFEDC